MPGHALSPGEGIRKNSSFPSLVTFPRASSKRRNTQEFFFPFAGCQATLCHQAKEYARILLSLRWSHSLGLSLSEGKHKNSSFPSLGTFPRASCERRNTQEFFFPFAGRQPTLFHLAKEYAGILLPLRWTPGHALSPGEGIRRNSSSPSPDANPRSFT